jgi:hypothetical protein
MPVRTSDREGLRDARADTGDHPVVRAGRERAQRHAGSSYGGPLDAEVPRADVRVEYQHPLVGLADVDVGVL